ncbi:MAG: RNA polymerase sigma factor [Mucilaginibacter sp.]
MLDFETIYSTYSPQIYRVCMGYVNDAEQAKDLTQETFISVWKNLSTFRHEAKIGTWIFRIATNNCLRAVEVSKRMVKVELPYHLPDKPKELQDDKLAFLYRAISELEEMERIIISLVLEDLPQAQIAEIVGLSAVNTRVRIHRIKEKLALKLRAYGQFE